MNTLISCSGEDDSLCNETTSAYITTNAGIVTYTASVTGDSTISSLSLGGPDGEITVDGPDLPFSQAIEVPAGANVFIQITARVRNGEVSAGHAFTDGASEINQDQIVCTN